MHTRALQLLILFALICKKWIGAELFTSIAELESLIETQAYVTDEIEKYLQREDYRLGILRKYLRIFKREQEVMKRDETWVGNPLNAFSLIHALTDHLKNIEYYVHMTPSALEKPENLRFPVDEDLHGAAVALSRLQKTYNLNVSSLVGGRLIGTYSHGNKLYAEEGSRLSGPAIFEVGRVLYTVENDYKLALEWLHEALARGDTEDFSDYYNQDLVIDYIRNAYHGINDFKSAIKWTKKLLEFRPTDDELHASLCFYTHKLRTNDSDVITVEEPFKETSELCRGEVALAEDVRKDLHCHYKHGPSAFLRIAPIKAEHLNHDPEVYLFYDVISDKEIEFVTNIVQTSLERSEVYVDGKFAVHRSRTSKLAWIYDGEYPVVDTVSLRIEDFTELSLKKAEGLQIANYGIGGHYESHYDCLQEEAGDNGERIATVLFYLSDVEQGGATVFPRLNLTVFPVKNAALFWYNVLPSGEQDYRTLHAACPVLRGSKWGANKWIRMAGNEFIRPCGLEYQHNEHLDEPDDVDGWNDSVAF